jgi:hypothetical protein
MLLIPHFITPRFCTAAALQNSERKSSLRSILFWNFAERQRIGRHFKETLLDNNDHSQTEKYMEIDKLIKDLNKKITSQAVSVERMDKEDLTEAEEQFLNKYKPQQSIIIYGTLAPNRSNHSKIKHINGKWIKGFIKGKLVKEG